MKKKSKITSIILAFLLIMTVFTACSSSSSTGTKPADTPSKQDTAGKDEKVTLTVLVANSYDRSGLDAVIKKIEEKLNISTEVEIRPGGAEGENIIRARLAAGESSDMHIFNSGSLLSSLNPVKNFYPLNSQPIIEKFTDSYLATVTVDGQIFGVPSSSSFAGAWLYNKKVYNELGLSVPKTWDELLENCRIIKEAGKTAVIGSFASDWTSQLILLADYYNVQAKDPGFAEKFNSNKDKYATNEHALRAFYKMRDIYDGGFLNPDYNATTLEVALQMLVDGEGVHYPMLTSTLANIASSYGDEAANNIGVFAQPGDDPNNVGLTVWMPDSFYIYKDSPYIDYCLKWLEFYVSDEGLNVFSSVQKPTGPYVIKGAPLPDDAYAGVKEMLSYFENGKTAPALEFITSVKGPNSPQICIMALGGLDDPLNCAKLYDEDVEKQAKQLGLPGW